MSALTFRLVPGSYAICRLAPSAAVPEWADRAPFCSLTRTPEELSIVCPAGAVPPTLAAEGGRAQGGWALLQLVGPFPFSAVGICAEISGLLAGAGISLIALATFDTDYFLVQESDLPRAVEVLGAAGHVRVEPLA